jgi:NAD-dependent dihydropyrimidine dehydrogenase PreA subunit
MEGSVQREGEKVRIFLALADARDGYRLWSSVYDFQTNGSIDAEEMVSREIADLSNKKLHELRETQLVGEGYPTKEEAEFETATQLYINPDECIDCAACEPACPVAAIFPEDEVPEKWKSFIKVNYGHYEKEKG